MQIIQLSLRLLQFLWTLLIMAIVGNMIALANHGNPSIINYDMFVAVVGMLSLFVLIPASIKDGILPGIALVAADVLNSLFTFCGAVAMAAYLGAHSCSNHNYLNNNQITNGADDKSMRCHEAQAVTAFLWFSWASWTASAVMSGLSSRGGGFRK